LPSFAKDRASVHGGEPEAVTAPAGEPTLVGASARQDEVVDAPADRHALLGEPPDGTDSSMVDGRDAEDPGVQDPCAHDLGDGDPDGKDPVPEDPDASDIGGGGSGSTTKPAARRRGWRRLFRGPVWQVGRILILLLLIEYLVVPQLAGPRKVLHLVTEVNPFLLLLGVGLEAASLLSYSQLSRTVLPGGRSISIFTMLRVQMSTLSVSHSLPGGSATGTALGYRLLTQSGVARSDVGFGLATQAIGSAVVLNVVLWTALIVSIPVWGFSAVYLLAAVVGILLLLTSGALVAAFTRGGDRVGDALERAAGHIPFVDGVGLRRAYDQASERLKALSEQRALLVRALGWAAANWLFDAASLEVFVGAFGHWVNPDGLLVAYGLAYVLAALPITPGGLGVVEATLTSLLVGFGTPRGIAVLGVVTYRLINFWLPIPLGGLAYLSLQTHRRHANHHSGAEGMPASRPWWRHFQHKPPAI
jgi:uncharacterized protein (TIRG00374 family)